MKQLKSTSVYIDGEVHRAVKAHAARFGVRWGDAIEAMLAVFDALPLEAQARAMASCDKREGALIPTGETAFLDSAYEAEHIETERALAAVPPRINPEDF